MLYDGKLLNLIQVQPYNSDIMITTMNYKILSEIADI